MPAHILDEIDAQIERECQELEAAFEDLVVEPAGVILFPVKRVRW